MPSKPPLLVTSRIWRDEGSNDRTIWFLDVAGKRRNADNYQECRDYAAKHGYPGIRIVYR